MKKEKRYEVFGRIIGIKDSKEKSLGFLLALNGKDALKKARRNAGLIATVTRVKLNPIKKLYYKGKRISAEKALQLSIHGKKVDSK